MANHLTRSSSRRVGVAIAVATLASGAVASAQASEIQRAYIEHTRTCLGLFFTDRAAHAEQCLPNNSPNIPANAGSGGNGTRGAVVPPPVVVVVPPPPPPEAEPEPEPGCVTVQTNCGPVCSYPA